MTKVLTPTNEELFRQLSELNKRLRAVERRNLATFNLVGPSPALLGFAANTDYGNSDVDRAFSHLLVANATRVAYLFDAHSTGGKTCHFRLCAVNDANPYKADLPGWQVLDTFDETSGSYQVHRGNVVLPDQVKNGEQWNFSVHGRIQGGNGTTDTWNIRAWGLVLTDDPDFRFERGD